MSPSIQSRLSAVKESKDLSGYLELVGGVCKLLPLRWPDTEPMEMLSSVDDADRRALTTSVAAAQEDLRSQVGSGALLLRRPVLESSIDPGFGEIAVPWIVSVFATGIEVPLVVKKIDLKVPQLGRCLDNPADA